MRYPIVHIKVDEIANSKYPIKEIPFPVTEATIHIDYASRAPVTIDLKGEGNIAVDCASGLRHIEIGGKTYRLVETDHVQPMPDASAPQLHD